MEDIQNLYRNAIEKEVGVNMTARDKDAIAFFLSKFLDKPTVMTACITPGVINKRALSGKSADNSVYMATVSLERGLEQIVIVNSNCKSIAYDFSYGVTIRKDIIDPQNNNFDWYFFKLPNKERATAFFEAHHAISTETFGSLSDIPYKTSVIGSDDIDNLDLAKEIYDNLDMYIETGLKLDDAPTR